MIICAVYRNFNALLYIYRGETILVGSETRRCWIGFQDLYYTILDGHTIIIYHGILRLPSLSLTISYSRSKNLLHCSILVNRI